jgi:hypothetical protein
VCVKAQMLDYKNIILVLFHAVSRIVSDQTLFRLCNNAEAL